MRFEEFLHWNDGLFLQPHHMQHLQRTAFLYGRKNRSFYMSYPSGLIDFEMDLEALASARVIVKRFSALMPDGTEISMPGNTVLPPLDLSGVIKEHPEDLTLFLAVPLWSEFEPNLAENDGASSRRMFLTREHTVRDENTGDNEITLITRKINARLITQFDDPTDLQVLPILKLTAVSDEGADKKLIIDEKYVPPFMILTSDCALSGHVTDLLYEVRRCRDKLLNDLTVAQFKPENFSGINAYNVLQLRILNLYENRLSCLLSLPNLTPFALYLELRSFLAELMGLHPMNDIKDIQNFVHFNCAPQFFELMNDIRSLISSEGGASYIRLTFRPDEGGEYLYAELSADNIVKADEYYLAVHCDAEDRTVITALEKGDTFKLINPEAKRMRARGVKLTEMRYPPRFLPSLSNTLWFRLQLDETPRTWREICEEKGIVIDYAGNMFPNLEASLFLTVIGGKTRKD
mgnify:FL=1|jgi:type VI secretion system protein ImpJ